MVAIYDASALLGTYYDGASTGKRLVNLPTQNPTAQNLSAQAQTLLVARSRHLIRNNPVAKTGMRKFAAAIVGKGIMPHSIHPDRLIREAINTAWKRSSSEIVVGKGTEFAGLQTLLTRALFSDGEAFVLRRRRDLQSGLYVPLQVQILDTDMCPVHDYGQRSTRVRNGIIVDEEGAPVGYRFYKQNPLTNTFDNVSRRTASTETQDVPAELVAHVFDTERVNQMRGIPTLAPAIVALQMIDELSEATVTAQKIATLLSWFVYRDDSGARIFGEDEDPDDETRGDASVGAGSIIYLEPGEKIESSDPPETSSNVLDMIKFYLHNIAGSIGLTYEMLTSDLKEVNFSSIRAGLNQFIREAENYIYQVLIHRFCQPVFNWWLDSAVISGRLSLPGYGLDPYPYRDIKWTYDRFPYVNPLDEAQADVLLVDNLLKSRTTVIEETQDRTAEEAFDEMQREREAMSERGLPVGQEGTE